MTTIYKLSFSSWIHNAGSFLVIEGLGGLLYKKEFTYEMVLYLFSLLRILRLTFLLFKKNLRGLHNSFASDTYENK